MIKLIDDYFVDASENQYILKRKSIGNRKNPETGEKKETIVYYDCGYYGSMKSCVEGCIRKCLLKRVASGEIETMREWLDEMRTHMEAIGGRYD